MPSLKTRIAESLSESLDVVSSRRSLRLRCSRSLRSSAHRSTLEIRGGISPRSSDLRFFSCLVFLLAPVVLHSVARQLILGARDCPPIDAARHRAQSSGSARGSPTASPKRSASRKSFLRPRRPQFDSACARCSVPDVASAPSRVWPIGFQCRSRVPQTGFRYCAVDSITTSPTCCSTSHAASERP